jgi:hypothetical protein
MTHHTLGPIPPLTHTCMANQCIPPSTHHHYYEGLSDSAPIVEGPPACRTACLMGIVAMSIRAGVIRHHHIPCRNLNTLAHRLRITTGAITAHRTHAPPHLPLLAPLLGRILLSLLSGQRTTGHARNLAAQRIVRLY